MKKWKRYVPVGMLGLVAIMAAVLTFHVKAETEPKTGTIPDRVYFGEIKVGGMTGEEASQAVEEYVQKLGSTGITLKAGENTLETTAAALGLSWNNPEIVEEAEGLGKSGNLVERYKAMKDLEHEDKRYTIGYTVDVMKVAAVLEENIETLNTEAVDAGLSREDGAFVVIPGSQGVSVAVEDSVKLVEEYFNTQWKEQPTEIELIAEVVNPRGTEEELSKVKDVLGSYHTDFSTSAAGRVANVTNGAERINGHVIYPGEQFSVYQAVSPFTKENGYELAGSYENGTTVESYGGGICQVSTTLYNAAIRAELEIAERSPHSMLVSYVKPSEDAAIAGDYKDLKFINNTGAPIYIEGYTANRVIYFNIYGQETREANREVIFISETTESMEPEKQFRGVGTPIGTITRVQGAHQGMKAQLIKVVKVNGEEVSRETFNTSTYRSSPAIYEVGTISGLGNIEAANNMMSAIATQDEETIRAAAAAWSDEALTAAQSQQPPEDTEPEDSDKENDKPDKEKPDKGQGKPDKEKPGQGKPDKESDKPEDTIPEEDAGEEN